MDLGLSGKRAVVAAASEGLGRAVARSLSREGARVVICGRDEERLRRSAADLGENVAWVVADVGEPGAAAAFTARAAELLGGIDILVPNAGGPPPGEFASVTIGQYEAALRLNLLSVVAMCQQAVPLMRTGHWGRIVAITSVTVRKPLANLIASTTARSGTTGFLRALATEVGPDGITVNSVQPGYHSTARMAAVYGDDPSSFGSKVPMRRMGDPADFGACVAFLCSEQARYITGADIPIDGGSSLV